MSGERDLDPNDWEALKSEGRRMLDEMIDYLQQLREGPLWRPIPAEARRRFRAPLPTAPGSLDDAYETFRRDVLPYAGANLHPGFMGWVQGAGTPVGMLAEMLAGALNANLGGRDHMPIEVERQVLAWLAEIVGFPETSGGVLLTGASMANFVGVLVARQRALTTVRSKGIAGVQLTGYSSTAAHGCVARAFEMAGLGSEALKRIAVDADHRIDLAALAAAIAADRQAGLQPFLIVGNAGTVDVGAIDDLAALADLAETERVHLHVDGAFGALGMLAAALRPKLAGLGRADSVAFDLHKWAQVPYDAGVILVRDAALQRATFASEAAYLSRANRGMAGGDWWPTDDGPELSRGFRALKAWFTFAVLGTEAIGASIARSCALAKELERRVRAEPRLELLAPVALNIVCFRYRADDADAVNRRIVADLQEAGEVAPSLTLVDGKAAIRAALFNHRSDERDIEALVRGALAFGDATVKGAA